MFIESTEALEDLFYSCHKSGLNKLTCSHFFLSRIQNARVCEWRKGKMLFSCLKGNKFAEVEINIFLSLCD